MNSLELWSGLNQTWQRFVRSQSALAIRDVMCLAIPTLETTELARIYEWYAARTRSAIRTAYAAVTAAVGALLWYFHDGAGQQWTIGDFDVVIALFVVIAFALLVCAVQHSELAQLPRERAVAMHLLNIFGQLVNGERLEAPIVQPLFKAPIENEEQGENGERGSTDKNRDDGQPANAQRSSTRCVCVAIMLFAILSSASAVAVLYQRSEFARTGLALVAFVVLLALLVALVALDALAFGGRLVAEIRPSRSRELVQDDQHPDGIDQRRQPRRVAESLVEQIGGVRLDEYINDRKISNFVNQRIKSAMEDTRVEETRVDRRQTGDQ